MGALGLLAVNWRRPKPPVRCLVDGPTLTVFGEGHEVLWEHTFPEPIHDSFGAGPSSGPRYRFFDLDGDGRTEVLFGYEPITKPESKLICFHTTGKIRWEFTPGKIVADNRGRQFTPPYSINSFGVLHLPGANAARVVIVSAHHWSFACQVTVLDGATGRLISEYWHRGHLPHLAIADLDHDGLPEVLVAGVNDAPGYKQATVLIFDGRQISGACRDPNGQSYFHDMPLGSEKAVLFFPRTAATAGHEFNIVSGLRVNEDRIVVSVNETGSAVEPYWTIYEFDHTLNPVSLLLSFELQQLYSSPDRSRRPLPSLTDEITDRLKREVEIIKRTPG